jgi:hypothetical protein
MMRGAMKCIQCGGVREGETVLISTDTNKLRIAEALAGAACAVGAQPIIIMIPPVGSLSRGRCVSSAKHMVTNSYKGKGGGNQGREEGKHDV